MKLLVATNNQHKLKEIKEILGKYFEEILSLKDLNINIDIIEKGKTFEENSFIKANEIHKICKDYSILADDSGICVEALNNEPGVFSARYSNKGDKENNKLLLKNLKNKTNRKAYFETSITFYSNKDNKFYSTTGKTYGKILDKEYGNNGFGYDSIFFSDELNKCFGHANSKEKNSVSHRNKALMKLVEILLNKNLI